MLFTQYMTQYEAEVRAVEEYARTGKAPDRFKYLEDLQARYSVDGTFDPKAVKAVAQRMRKDGYHAHYAENYLECTKTFSRDLNTCADDSEATKFLSMRFVQQSKLLYEYGYWTLNRPTVKIYPDYVTMFSTIRLDFSILEIRLPFTVFSVAFPVHDCMAVVGEGNYVPHSALLTVRSRCSGYDQIFRNRGDIKADAQQQLCFQQEEGAGLIAAVCFDESKVQDGRIVRPDKFQYPRAFITTMPFLDVPIDQGIASGYNNSFGIGQHKAEPGMTQDNPYHEGIMLAVKALITTALLAVNESEVVERDIVNADYQRYRKAVETGNEREMTELADRSDKKRGNVGLAIGRSDYVLGRRSIQYDRTARADDQGRELTHSHVRRAHFRNVRYGKGREQVKRVFQPMLIVRPDLPPAPGQRNYSTEHGK